MSRPRTATAILEARGAFKSNPDRKREDPKCSSPFPDVAPENLTPLQVKWWHSIRRMVPDGILTGADQLTVHLAAVLWSEFMVDSAGMNTGRIGQMRSVMGSLGLSPADRAKLATKPEGDDGDF